MTKKQTHTTPTNLSEIIAMFPSCESIDALSFVFIYSQFVQNQHACIDECLVVSAKDQKSKKKPLSEGCLLAALQIYFLNSMLERKNKKQKTKHTKINDGTNKLIKIERSKDWETLNSSKGQPVKWYRLCFIITVRQDIFGTKGEKIAKLLCFVFLSTCFCDGSMARWEGGLFWLPHDDTHKDKKKTYQFF